MWVIVISENKSDSRDAILDGLLDTKPVEEKFLSKVSTRWSIAYNVRFAKIWKSESGAKKILKMYEVERNNQPQNWQRNKFYYIGNKHFHIRRLSESEWNKIVDAELSLLENNYTRNKIKLENKRKQYGK